MRARKYGNALRLPVKVTLNADILPVSAFSGAQVTATARSLFLALMLRALPNTLTMCNLVAGCCAIAALFEGMPVLTLILAIVSLIMDLLDGFLARRLKVSSPLGVQLDSLADVISFGVVPGCILFVLLQPDGEDSGWSEWMPYASFLFTAGVSLRLAKFNIDTRDSSVFHGLPSPSAATLVFGLLWMQVSYHPWWVSMHTPLLLYALILLLPLLMLSNLRLWSMKGIHHPNGKMILIGFLAVFALLILFTGSAAVLLLVVLYILFGLANVMLKFY